MRTGAWGLCVIAFVSVLGVGASPASAQQDDLFLAARRSESQDVKKPDQGKVAHFSIYRSDAPSVSEADGVGLYATSKGKALDLTSPDRMLDGPSGSLFSQAAGVGWRNKNMSAMFGYMKPSSVKSATHFENDRAPIYKSRARFGVGWALHF